jgi:branched-chain amino acid transport system substrate-binding protein
MRRSITIAISVAASLVILAGCGSGGSSGSGGKTNGGGAGSGAIDIMVSAGTSVQGAEGLNSLMAVRSVKAAVAQVNSSGGIMGHKLALSVVDDKADPTTAVTELENKISSGHKPLAWLNAGPSNLSEAVLPILNQNKILSFNVGPTATSGNPSKFPLNFDMTPSSVNFGTAFCPYAKSQGNTKIAILYTDDAYGDVLGPSIKQQCVSDGSTVTGIQKFDPTALDMTPQIQALQAGNPQTLVLVGYGAPVGYILNGITKLGWSVPILGDVAVADTDVVNTAPPKGLLGTAAVQNLRFEVFASTLAKPAAQQPAALNTMIAQLTALGPLPSSLALAFEYDGVQLLKAAIDKAGSTIDATAIASALVGLSAGDAQTGVFPQYFFKANDHSPNEPPQAFTFVSPSKLSPEGQFDASN